MCWYLQETEPKIYLQDALDPFNKILHKLRRRWRRVSNLKRKMYQAVERTHKVHHAVHRKPVIPLVYYMVMVKVTCAMSTNIGDAVIKEIKQVPWSTALHRHPSDVFRPACATIDHFHNASNIILTGSPSERCVETFLQDEKHLLLRRTYE